MPAPGSSVPRSSSVAHCGLTGLRASTQCITVSAPVHALDFGVSLSFLSVPLLVTPGALVLPIPEFQASATALTRVDSFERSNILPTTALHQKKNALTKRTQLLLFPSVDSGAFLNPLWLKARQNMAYRISASRWVASLTVIAAFMGQSIAGESYVAALPICG